MSTFASKRFAPVLAVGLALLGAALGGPAVLDWSAGDASASALVGVPAFEGPPPPPPDPVPIIDKHKQVNRGPNNSEEPQPRPRPDGGDPATDR